MKNVRFVCLFSYFVCVIVCMQCSAQTTAAARTRQTIDGGGAEGASLSSNALPAAIQRPQFAKPVAYYGVTPCDGWPANPESVAIGDLRGNGKNDLVVGGYCDLDVLLGNGDGTFQTAVTYGSGGSGGNEPVIGDVNGDGIPDLVVANQCQSGTESNCSASGEIGVLLGNGDGTFQPAVGYSSGGGPANAVAIADVNGDGFPDLVVANGCIEANCENGGTSVLLGNGDGTFQAPVSYLLVGGYFPLSLAIADLNADGIPDLVLGSCTISRCDETGAVSVMLGNGDGTFQNPVTYNISGEAESVAAADLNGDGIPDLAVAATSQISFATEVDVFLGNGDGTFQAPVGYSAGVSYGPTSLAIADVNGDGNLDVIGNGIETDLSGQVSVLLGYGNGTFGSPKVDHTIYSTGGHNGSCVWVAVGDLNGDKRPDLAVVNTVDYTVVAMLNTTLTSTATTIASSLNPVQVNQPVTFTATITSTGLVPNGSTITFLSDRVSIGTATTTNGVATLTTSFADAKTYTIEAGYLGGGFLRPSHKTLKQVVQSSAGVANAR